MKKYSLRGFTLVELLVVMAIIGILAGVILGGFRSSQRRSRDAVRKSDLRQVAQALEIFYSDHDRYPSSINGMIVSCPFYTGMGVPAPCSWGTGEMEDDQGHLYFRQVPQDPMNDAGTPSYYYRTLLTNQAFQLYARLENTEDADLIDPATLPAGVVCGAMASATCNFSITSPNVTPTDL